MQRQRVPLILSATALVVAVFGSTPLGNAAFNAIAPQSVGVLQLRDGSVTKPKIRGDAVTSAKVLNGSLRVVDFARGQIPPGPAGPKGDTGAAGATNVVVRRGNVLTTVGAIGSGQAVIECAEGERATGGGLGLPDENSYHSAIQISTTGPTPRAAGATPTGWFTGFTWSQAGLKVVPFVVCAKP